MPEACLRHACLICMPYMYACQFKELLIAKNVARECAEKLWCVPLFVCLMCMPYICLPYMYALYVCLTYACLMCMPCMYACLICMPYMLPYMYACLTCMPYICIPYMYDCLTCMYVCLIYACLICMPYMYAGGWVGMGNDRVPVSGSELDKCVCWCVGIRCAHGCRSRVRCATKTRIGVDRLV